MADPARPITFVKLHLWSQSSLQGFHSREIFVKVDQIVTMTRVENQPVIRAEEHFKLPIKERLKEDYTSIGFNFGCGEEQGGIEVIEAPDQIMRIIGALELI